MKNLAVIPLFLLTTSQAFAVCPDLTADNADKINLACEFKENINPDKEAEKLMTGATDAGFNRCTTSFPHGSNLKKLLEIRNLQLKGEESLGKCVYQRKDNTTYIYIEADKEDLE